MLYNARYSLHACNDRHILKALVPLIPNLALLRVVLLNQSIEEKLELELKTFLYTHVTQFFHQILTSSKPGKHTGMELFLSH